MGSQFPPRIFHAADAVKFLQPELLDQLILHRAARQDTDEYVTRTLEPEHLASDIPETSTAGNGGRSHGKPPRLAAIRRHEAGCRFESHWDHKCQKRAGEKPKQGDTDDKPTMQPEQPQMLDGVCTSFGRLLRAGRN